MQWEQTHDQKTTTAALCPASSPRRLRAVPPRSSRLKSTASPPISWTFAPAPSLAIPIGDGELGELFARPGRMSGRAGFRRFQPVNQSIQILEAKHLIQHLVPLQDRLVTTDRPVY